MTDKSEAKIQEDFVQAYLHTFKYLGDFMSVAADKYELSFETYRLMHLIAESDEQLTMVKIAEAEGVSRSAIARQISTLLKKALIEQVTSPQDRRIKYLSLTAQGRQIEAALTEENSESFHRWLEVYGKDRAIQTLQYISDYNDKVKAEELLQFEKVHDKRHTYRVQNAQ